MSTTASSTTGNAPGEWRVRPSPAELQTVSSLVVNFKDTDLIHCARALRYDAQNLAARECRVTCKIRPGPNQSGGVTSQPPIKITDYDNDQELTAALRERYSLMRQLVISLAEEMSSYTKKYPQMQAHPVLATFGEVDTTLHKAAHNLVAKNYNDTAEHLNNAQMLLASTEHSIKPLRDPNPNMTENVTTWIAEQPTPQQHQQPTTPKSITTSKSHQAPPPPAKLKKPKKGCCGCGGCCGCCAIS